MTFETKSYSSSSVEQIFRYDQPTSDEVRKHLRRMMSTSPFQTIGLIASQ